MSGKMVKGHKQFVQTAIVCALAICLSIIENYIPMPGILYGVKPGLSNIAVMVSLAVISPLSAFGVVILKAVVTALLTGSLSALPYSLAGGILAFFVMYLLFSRANKKISFVGIGVFGAALHSTGQVMVSAAILQSTAIFAYLPLLLLASVITGFFTGLCTNLTVYKIARISVE